MSQALEETKVTIKKAAPKAEPIVESPKEEVRPETPKEVFKTLADDLYGARIRRRLSKEEIEEMRIKDRELVRGVFKNNEQPGQPLKFDFLKYPNDNIEQYHFEDGRVYTIPRGVAMHIVNGCAIPEHSNMMDEKGRHVAVIGKKFHRFSFTPLDFMDERAIRDLTPSKVEEVRFL